MFGRRSKKLPTTVATGLSLLQGGDRDGALRAFAEASHTSDPHVLRALGAAYQQAGEDGYAEHCLRLAAQSGSRDALNDLGVLLKKQNRIEEAEQALRQASDLGCANASNNLGNLWEMRGDLQAAAWYWHRAAEGGVPRAMVSLGVFLATTGQQADARIFYDRARAALPHAPEIRDQFELLGNMLGVPVQGAPMQGAPMQGGPFQGAPFQGGPVPSGPVSGGAVPGGAVPGVPGAHNDPFGPTMGRVSGSGPAAGPAAGGTPPGGIAPSDPGTGGIPAGDFGTGSPSNPKSLTRMDTALTTKRPVPAEESSASQPTSGEYAPTMISRSAPQVSAVGEAVTSGDGDGSDAPGSGDIDTATVRNPRFRSQQPSDEAPWADPHEPEPADLDDSAAHDSAPHDGTAGSIAVAETGTSAVVEPEPEPAPEPAGSGGSAPFDPTIIRPTGPWPTGPWATEARRELRGEEPPTAYHRRLPTFSPAESGQAPALQDPAAPAAPAVEPAAATAFDLSDNLRTVEKLRASYMDTRNATTLLLALEINKVGVESAPPDDPTAQALALSLRCTLLRLSFERDRQEAALSEAITAGRLAKSLFKSTDAGFPKALNSLATALQAEYGRAQDPTILAEALALYREAVRALPEGHPELPAMFTNIANVLMTQGLAERSPQLLDAAIHSAREAVGMSDPDGTAYAARQASLGMALLAHYANFSGPAAELDEAERLFNAALATLPENHALRPQVQNYLSSVSTLRHA
jgi:tetratricopeptide (TPR) repeat protein